MNLSELQKTGKQLEKEIVAAVKSFMESKGWRPIRMQRTTVPGSFSTGEPGIPDFLWLNYVRDSGICVHLWTEFKRPGGKLSEKQVQWIARERMRGALVAVVDDVKEYCEWYQRTFGWLHDGRMKGQVALF